MYKKDFETIPKIAKDDVFLDRLDLDVKDPGVVLKHC
jgi:hypothetical protein